MAQQGADSSNSRGVEWNGMEWNVMVIDWIDAPSITSRRVCDGSYRTYRCHDGRTRNEQNVRMRTSMGRESQYIHVALLRVFRTRFGTIVQYHSNSRNVSSLLLGVRSRSTNLVRLLPVFRMSFLFRSSNVLHTPSTGPTYR